MSVWRCRRSCDVDGGVEELHVFGGVSRFDLVLVEHGNDPGSEAAAGVGTIST